MSDVIETTGFAGKFWALVGGRSYAFAGTALILAFVALLLKRIDGAQFATCITILTGFVTGRAVGEDFKPQK